MPKADTMTAKTFSDFISLTPVGDNTFRTLHNPERMGNSANIAYGGCAIAAALNAAFHTLPPSHAQRPYHLYSTTGYYLGPALTDRPLTCRVRAVRDTRTFATRSVEVSQETDGGGYGGGSSSNPLAGAGAGERKVLTMLADFQTAEPASILTYSAPPTRTYGRYDAQQGLNELHSSRVARGEIPAKAHEALRTSFGLSERFIESRPCIEGIFAQNLMGILKGIPTSQDGLKLTDKTSADWFRFKHGLDDEAKQLSALLFAMDAAIAFMPLSHSKLFLEDTAAVSTLDFAFRVFSNSVDVNRWHFREMTTIAGANGRTYSEARLWDTEGNMVCSMTQQSIARPRKDKAAKI